MKQPYVVMPFEAARDEPGIHSACFELEAPDDTLARLSACGLSLPEELARAVPRRQAEFMAGRYAAGLALQSLGESRAVGRSPKGMPVWPSGVVGSITHGGGIAAAAVSSADMYAGIGIDCETVMTPETAQSVRAMVAEENELLLVNEALRARSRIDRELCNRLALTLVFSAKESFYKCVYPLSAQFLDFSEVKLVLCRGDAPSRGVFAVRLERDLASGLSSGTVLSGRFVHSESHIKTLVALSRGSKPTVNP